MVARRRFLGWVALVPAGLVLGRCSDERGRVDALDTADAADAADADAFGDAEVGAGDAGVGGDAEVDAGLEVVEPRECLPTRPDALGPFYEEGTPAITDLSGTEAGTRIAMSGQVLDVECRPIAGASIEVWQADDGGDYHDDRLRGTLTADGDGRFAFTSIMPGRYAQATGLRPAHLHYRVSASGYRTIVTQIYFEGDPYLAPNDSCRTCGSGDADRVVAMVSREGVLEGVCDVILAPS